MTDETIIDLDREFWASLTEAAKQSAWIPSDYMVNEWVSDCCDFLRAGSTLQCGKYEIRQGPDGVLIARDASDDFEFVITEVNIGAFMHAGLMVLGKAPPVTLENPPAESELHDLGCMCPFCTLPKD